MAISLPGIQGGAHKQNYRIVDFRRNKDGIPAKVERLEYDPNRSANLALLRYADGERRYIVAPKGLTVGTQVVSGSEAPIKPGNTLPLRNIPVGTTIHCIEMVPVKGAQLARAAGTPVQLLAREGSYAQIRLRSGEIRRVHVECRATIGEVGNEENNLRSIGKAGARRWRGIRPTVRGVAMNPVDHPHGGGDGRTAAGMDPVSPWGTKIPDMVVYSANWPDTRDSHWKALLKARAKENQCYVVGVNRTGKDENGFDYPGASTIIDYSGQILQEMDEKEGFFTQKIDKDEMTRYSNELPFLNDREII